MSNRLIRNLTADGIAKYMSERFHVGDRVTLTETIKDDKSVVEKRRKGKIICINGYYTAVQVKKNKKDFILTVLHSDVYYHNAMRKSQGGKV